VRHALEVEPVEPPPVRKRLVPYKQASVVIHRSPQWMRNRIKTGHVKAVRVGRSLFLTLDELARIQREGVAAWSKEDAGPVGA
jgi:hypothetical protein